MRASCLVITSNATLDIGGEGIFAAELASELKNNESIGSSFLVRNELKGAELIRDLKFYEARLPHIRNSILLVVNLLLFAVTAIPLALTFIKDQRKENQTTLIHAHDGAFSGVVGVIVSKLSSTPLVITFHGTHILSSYYIFNRLSYIARLVATCLTNFCVKNAHNLIAVDPNTEKCVKYATKTRKNIEIIPTFCRKLGAKTRVVRERTIPNLPANSTLIGYIGRLSPEKNVLGLVKAFWGISEIMPNAYLIIVGDGVLREKIVQHTKEMRIQNKVLLLGYLYDIEPILRKLSCIVLPSESEGLPQVVLEAWSLGVPVVGSNRIGCLRNRINALTFPPKDTDKLKGALVQILSNTDLAKKITERAREQPIFPSKESVVKEYASIYLGNFIINRFSQRTL